MEVIRCDAIKESAVICAARLKSTLANLSRRCIGRRNMIRTGRFLVNAGMARGSNHPATNGEFDYLSRVIGTQASHEHDPTVIDIGANLGIYCSHASRLLHGRGRIFAAEPCDATMAQLRKNTHGLPTPIDYLDVAFSHAEGDGQLFVVGPGAGTNSLEGVTTQTEQVERVALMTLDGFLERNHLPQVDFVKIDTEGHDFSVLRGARNSLSAGRIRALQFEYNWRWIGQRSFLRDVFQLVEGMDYQIGRVTPFGIETLDAWNQGLETLVEDNYALYRTDVAASLKLVSPAIS